MKKLITILPAIVLTFILSGYAEAAYDANVDYSNVMITSVMTGANEAGLAAQQSRDEKIAALGVDVPSIKYEDLMLISKIIYAEAGTEWLSDEWKMCVGEVVLNRVASPEFPNTIKEVLEQPGQYYGANSRYFNSLVPNYRCVFAALRLLNGQRLLEPSVVFQANFKQGGGTHTAVYDKYLGWTYFCYSSNTQLYQK